MPFVVMRLVCPAVIEPTHPKKIANGTMAVMHVQYENNRPILLENGRLVTRIAPMMAGMYISAPAYKRPMGSCDASVTPKKMVNYSNHLVSRSIQVYH